MKSLGKKSGKQVDKIYRLLVSTMSVSIFIKHKTNHFSGYNILQAVCYHSIIINISKQRLYFLIREIFSKIFRTYD
jgi:hypothetical protein